MSSKFTPSQNTVFNEIINKFNKFSRIHNYLLIGKSGSGKTYLMKRLCEKVDGVYINFEIEFGLNFFNSYDYRVIDENLFLKYISNKIDSKYSDKVIFVDGVASVLNSLYEQNHINKLISSYMTRSYRNKYLMSFSNIYVTKNDLDRYQNKIFVLNYTKEDNAFISKVNKTPLTISQEYNNAHYFKFAN